MRILFLFMISSCSIIFGGKQVPQSARGSQYIISFKSPEWSKKSQDRSDYVFENKNNGRILLSNSFCDEFQSSTLENLAHKTFKTAVSDFQPVISKYTTFHSREAYHMEGTGSLDGVQVALRLLNTRRNNCYYDFVSIDPNTTAKTQDPEFENFLNSVEFR